MADNKARRACFSVAVIPGDDVGPEVTRAAVRIGDTARVPDHVSLELLLAIRKGFDQYVNLRPIYLYPGVDCPLKSARPGSIDMVVVRENVEGEYARLGGRFKQGGEDEVTLQTSMFEPIHGSAPKYAGLDVVNPIAAVEAVRRVLAAAEEKRGGPQ